MKFSWGLVLFLPQVWAQICAPPLTLRPNDTVAASLGQANCRLSDNSAYAEYSLVLPARGRLVLDGSAAGFPFGLILRDANQHKIAAGARIDQAIERGSYRVLVNAA